jgi:uncharacterized repeat protein (TIGR03803 family)
MKTILASLSRAAFAGAWVLGLAAMSAHAQSYSIVHSFGTLSNLTGFHPVAPLIQGLDGTLYGTTSEGEYSLGLGGTVFKLQPDGSGFAVLKYFTNYAEAWGPQGGLVLSGSTLYGTAEGNGGTVFKVNTDGSGFAVLKQFLGNDADGQYPYAGLALSGTTLYGTTYAGGNYNYGAVFKLNTDGGSFAVLRHLNTADGVNPYAPLVVSGSTLYGTASGGGSNLRGTVFKLSTAGTDFTVLRHLATVDGSSPSAGLVLSGSTLYGTASRGGSNDFGTAFKLNTNGTGFTVLKHFTAAAGGFVPSGTLWLSGTTLYGTALVKYVRGGAVFKLGTNGGSYEVIKQFASTNDGLNPVTGLWLSGSTLYGTTYEGGSDDAGVLFKVNTNGSGFGVLKSFVISKEGVNPQGGLLPAGSTLYGTTVYSAHTGYGTVYRVNADGSGFTVLHVFDLMNGSEPCAGLVLSGTTLYGTTSAGGGGIEAGVVFKVNTNGSDFTVMKSFSGNADGAAPRARLTLSGDTLYGTTAGLSYYGSGNVFKIRTNGSDYVGLKSFDGGPDGGSPQADLVVSGTTLYGTTGGGGSVSLGTVFKLNTNGANFSVLKDYDGSDGYAPWSGLVLAGDTLYGTTTAGGSLGYGTVFKVHTNGSSYTVLKEFDGYADGGSPQSALALSGDTLYGTTYSGGAFDFGTVFKLNTDGSDYAVLKEFTGPEGGHPSGPLALAGSTLYGTTSEGGTLNAGVIFSLSLLPSLRIQFLSPNSLLLAWPYPSTDFSLQQNASLTTTNWSSVTNPPVQVGGEWQVTLTPPAGNRFYRLHKP